jgi:hypothetical protein
MQTKLLIAGAVVVIIAICAIAVAALTLSQGPGQASTSAQPAAPAITPTPGPAIGLGSVTGSVTDTCGQPLPGLLVTLHLMGYNDTSGAWELYNLTTTTYQDEPFKGRFVFDNVELVPGLKYAYLTTQVPYNDSVYYGSTDNFTLQANSAANKSIVLHLPPEIKSMVLNST